MTAGALTTVHQASVSELSWVYRRAGCLSSFGLCDHSFLEICECAVAVDNAIASIKAKADFCTRGSASEGVVELIDEFNPGHRASAS